MPPIKKEDKRKMELGKDGGMDENEDNAAEERRQTAENAHGGMNTTVTWTMMKAEMASVKNEMNQKMNEMEQKMMP